MRNTNQTALTGPVVDTLPADINPEQILTDLTNCPDDDKVLSGFKASGLSKDRVIEALVMLEKQDILSQYDFDNLKPDAKGMYRIWVPDVSSKNGKTRLYAKDIENLKEKVYLHVKKQPYHQLYRTFGYCFEEAMKFELQNTSPERQVSRNNTIDRNRSEYRRFFKDTAFESRFIDYITVRDIDEVVRLNLRRYRLTKSGRDSMRTIINTTFKRAYFMGWVEENVSLRVIWKDYDRLVHQSAPIKKRAYSVDQIRSLHEIDLNRQKEEPDFITAYAHEFQLLTGFRRAEICPLRWDDIDLEDGSIYVHQEQLVDRGDELKHVIVNHTKTFKDRYYPIADQEQEFLEKLYAVHEKYYPQSPFLFPAKTENGCITCKAVEDYHRRSCNKLGIPISIEYKRGPHAFRRNRITEAVNNTNGNLMLVAEMYGNSPETIRKNYYVNGDIESMRQALNKRKVI